MACVGQLYYYTAVGAVLLHKCNLTTVYKLYYYTYNTEGELKMTTELKAAAEELGIVQDDGDALVALQKAVVERDPTQKELDESKDDFQKMQQQLAAQGYVISRAPHMTEEEIKREAMRIAQFPEQLEKIINLAKKYRGES